MSYIKNILPTLLLTVISLLTSFNADAAILKGEVCDSVTGETIPYATVRLLTDNGAESAAQVALFITDANGLFSETINKSGKMTLRVESMGYKALERQLDLQEDETIELGTISLADDDELLSEIVVVGMRPIIKAEPDKISYDVQADGDSNTNTLLEMLRKVPMVSVDGEDNITVNGSSNFQVYVNGKPSMMFSSNPGQILKSMPASMVKSIEVVTNPGARYDAEGAGGILNIVMDSQTGDDNTGYTAGVGIRGGTRGFDMNANISGQSGKFSYSANGMYNKMYPGQSETGSEQILPDRNILTESTGKPKMNFAMGNISAEYAIDSLSTIGITGSITSFRLHSEGSTATTISSAQGDVLTSYSSTGFMHLNRLSASGSLSFSHDFRARTKPQLSLIYQLSSERNKTNSAFDFSDPDYNEDNTDLSDRDSRNLENTLDNIVQADFTMHPRAGHTLDTGVKVNLRKSNSSSATDFLTGTSENDNTRYHNRSNILAAYAEYALEAGKFNVKGGLRYEYNLQKVNYDGASENDFSRSYGTAVPSASASYKLTPLSNIGLTYNMRIARPGISYMNPYVDKSDPTSISYGNPGLKNETMHNFGLSYNLFKSRFMLNTRLSDSYTSNGIEQYRYISDGILNTTYGNVAKRNSLRLDVSATWLAGKTTRLILNGAVSYVTLRNREMSLSNKGFQCNVMAGVQQTLPLDIKASAFVIASSKSHTIEGWNSGFKMLSLNLSKSLLNNRLTVSGGFNTGLSRGGRMVMDNYSHTSDFTRRNTIRMPMMSATVGISYTLGSLHPKQNSKRKAVNSDYMEQRSEMESISGPNTGGMGE
ncbi:MAG: TonB-dependent receptor [Muribaculaceae bacterium]|nr:TonB-dependent receptor [Muribaculaceae bacterium]